MIKKRVTIAQFNENIDWIKNIDKNIEVFIYNKKNDININYKSIEKNYENKFILRNVGRESHTYLIHIINNYNSLCDIEYFIQANPFDHSNDILSFININETLVFEQECSHPTIFKSIDGHIPYHMMNKLKY
jgi:hypothetical protein